MKKAFALFCLILSLSVSGFSQETDLRQLFLTAESYFLFEEFNEALPLYLQIHRHFPDNDNINYKIGVCFINSPYEKDKSIVYLEKAVLNINPKYRENNFKETSAPPEALYYLGNAYRINNQLNKAKEYYTKFLDAIDPEVYDTALVKAQIDACNAAANLMKKPIDFDREALSNRINTRFAETNPVVSGDETSIAYISKLQFYDAIFYARKVNGGWSAPRNIVSELGVDGDVYPTFLSYDGTEMFIYRSDEFIGNLYYTRLVNGKWSSLVKLNDNINTKYWESHASMSRDRKTLYFSSNRKGGYGGLDIYSSERQPNGEWGPAKNLGPQINTEYNDDTPFITETGNKLYFSSYGHYNMGGYDNFVSQKSAYNTWADPVNLGYPINTTDDDQFFFPLKDGQVAYYAQYSRDGQGRLDIYRYEIYNTDFPRMFPISGLLNYKRADVDSTEITVYVVKTSSGDTVTKFNPFKNGSFTFSVPAGNYNMIFSGERFKEHMQKLSVAENTAHKGFTIQDEIVLETLPHGLTQEKTDQMLTIRDTLISVDRDRDVNIRFNAETDSKAIVQVFNNSKLVNTDTIEVNSKRQSYEFKPLPGNNKVVITIADENGNIVQKSAEVMYMEKEAVTPTHSVIIPEDKPVIVPGSKLQLKATPATDSLGFSAKDVDQGLQEKTSDGELELLIKKMSEYSRPALKERLLSMEPQKEGIVTVENLIMDLFENPGRNNYAVDDVISMLSDYSSMSDLDLFLKRLIEYSEGNTRDYLLSIDTAEKGINSKQELVSYLLQQADAGEIDKTSIIHVILKASDIPVKIIMPDLQRLSDGKIRALLDQTPADIGFADKLFIDLISRTNKGGDVNSSEILDLFSNYLNKYDLQNFRNKLIENSEGNLLSFLKDKTAGNTALTQAGDLIKYMLDQSALNNYSHDEVYRTLARVIAQDNLKHVIQKMKYYAGDELMKALEELDIRKLNITSTDDLLDHLLRVAEKYGFEPSEVWNIVSKMALDERALYPTSQEASDEAALHKIFHRGVWMTAGILILEGIFIFILIILVRRKKKKTDEDRGSA